MRKGEPDRNMRKCSETQRTPFTPDQVREVHEAIRRAQQDIADWREKTAVDPQKMKEPLTRYL